LIVKHKSSFDEQVEVFSALITYTTGRKNGRGSSNECAILPSYRGKLRRSAECLARISSGQRMLG
jgi:hypothetical protein